MPHFTSSNAERGGFSKRLICVEVPSQLCLRDIPQRLPENGLQRAV